MYAMPTPKHFHFALGEHVRKFR